MPPLRIVVVGTLAGNPYAGMAWMHMQITAGLHRLGHDAWYFETTSSWPYDPVRDYKVCDSDYAVPYLERVAAGFGLQDRWAYRRSYLDKAWFGLDRAAGEELLRNADAVFNVAGATRFAEENLEVGRLVYFGTDPVYHEISYPAGDEETRSILAEHDEVVTYGENIGTPASPIPPLPGMRATTRQPVLMDSGPRARRRATSTPPSATGSRTGRRRVPRRALPVEQAPRVPRRSSTFPRRSGRRIELAMNLADPKTIQYGEGEPVKAFGLEPDTRSMLESHGWQLVEARHFTTDPWPYRDYILASRGEFTVARDLNVRLRSGWFSERSACYLAAGRPVVTQDTGFGTVLPTGEGLFAFDDADDVCRAFDAIESDYDRHSRAAREIAEEYFAVGQRASPSCSADLGLQ